MTLRVRIEGSDRHARSLRARLARLGGVVTVGPADLELVRASRVRPTFALDGRTVDGEEARVATALGASVLAWEGRDGWSHWQRCLAPIVAAPLVGAPDAARRWALVDEADAMHVPARCDDGWQWHVLVDRERTRAALPAHAVQWRADEPTSAPLLGAAEVVVGVDGPLVYDAWRLRRPVLAPTQGTSIEQWSRVERPELHARLAHTIPPVLADAPGFWEALVARAAAGPLPPTMDAAALRRAREQALDDARGRLGAVRRELRRLRDDPRAVAREARLWALRTMGSRARPPAPRG